MIALVQRLWNVLPRPLRMICAGGAATVVDTGTLLALCWIAGLAAGPAAVLGCAVGGVVNFAINRAWIFGASRGWARQALRYAVIVVGGGAAVTGLGVAALDAAGAPLLVAKAFATVLTLAVWTYPMSARVVFAPPSRQAREAGRTAADPESLALVR
jgi:putative flippase GtrA